MPSAEDERAAHAGAGLDTLLRDLDQQIAAIELPETPRPGSGSEFPSKAAAVMQALSAQIDRLCAQRELNALEAQHWIVAAERSVRTNDDVSARDDLARHSEHLRLFHEADAQLKEFQALLFEVRRLFPAREGRPSDDPGENAG